MWLLCLQGNKYLINVYACLISPETAGGNHKNVSILGKKCPVHKICEFFSPIISIRHLKDMVLSSAVFQNLILSYFFLSPTSQNSAVSLPTWLFKWSDFSTKRRNLSMQKSLRFVFSHQTFFFFFFFKTKNRFVTGVTTTGNYTVSFWRMSSSHSCWMCMSCAPQSSRRRCCQSGQSLRMSRTRSWRNSSKR